MVVLFMGMVGWHHWLMSLSKLQELVMDRKSWHVAVHGVTKSWTWLSDFTFTFHFHALEKEMATHSSVLAWRTPGMVEPGGLPSMGSHRVGHNWSDLAAAAERMKWTDGSAIFSLLRNLPTVFHCGCANFFPHNFMYLFSAVLGFGCSRAFSSCREWGLLASFVGLSLQCLLLLHWDSWALGLTGFSSCTGGSVFEAPGL